METDRRKAAKLVTYYRVSTNKQGIVGLGIDAQHEAIKRYMSTYGGRVIASYTEVESGKRVDRVELDKAIADCKRRHATLVIAKLDRLARNARFLLGLVESGAELAFCDLPQVPPGALGKFFLTLMAAVAELEAGMISERTKAALAAYKARGGKLGAHLPGCKRLTSEATRTGIAASAEVRKRKADQFADAIRDQAAELRASGLSFRAVAEALNADDNPTRFGNPLTAVTVLRILNRPPGKPKGSER